MRPTAARPFADRNHAQCRGCGQIVRRDWRVCAHCGVSSPVPLSGGQRLAMVGLLVTLAGAAWWATGETGAIDQVTNGAQSLFRSAAEIEGQGGALAPSTSSEPVTGSRFAGGPAGGLPARVPERQARPASGEVSAARLVRALRRLCSSGAMPTRPEVRRRPTAWRVVPPAVVTATATLPMATRANVGTYGGGRLPRRPTRARAGGRPLVWGTPSRPPCGARPRRSSAGRGATVAGPRRYPRR
jgi:hypothetical protein